MGVQEEQKSTFLTAFEHWAKVSVQLVWCTVLTPQLSLNVFVI